MVYLVYNRAPYSLIAKADGPVKTLKDVEGKTVSAPAGSATLRLLSPLAKKNGVDESRIKDLTLVNSLIVRSAGGIETITMVPAVEADDAMIQMQKAKEMVSAMTYSAFNE